jgi:hypothetical protein
MAEKSINGEEIIYELVVYSESDENDEWLGDWNTDLVGVIRNALTEELPSVLSQGYDLQVEIRIRYIGSGSIMVIFGAMIKGYTILSQYKNIVESVQIIRQQAKGIIERVLRRFSRNRRVGVQVNVRRVPSSMASGQQRSRESYIGRAAVSPGAFFYFLLVLCIVQFFFIVLLVAGAVIKTYF